VESTPKGGMTCRSYSPERSPQGPAGNMSRGVRKMVRTLSWHRFLCSKKREGHGPEAKTGTGEAKKGS